MKEISAFDYVIDKFKNIYVVRTEIDNGIFIAKPMYRFNKHKYTKIKGKIGKYFKSSLFNKNDYCDETEVILDCYQISEHLSAKSKPISKSLLEECQIDNYWSLFKKYEGEVFLYGSRLIGINNSASDIDVIFFSKKSADAIYGEFIDNKCIRPYNEEEIDERLLRYHKIYPSISKRLLLEIFQRATFYVKCEGKELGIFFGNIKPMVNYPNISNEISANDIEGIIVGNNENGCSMPRRFYVEMINKEIVTIHSSAWPLFGIGLLQKKIKIENAIKISDNDYWFNAKISKLRLI